MAAADAANSAGAAFLVTNQGDRYVWGANGGNLLGAGSSTSFAGGAAGPVPPTDGLFWSGIGRVELGRDFSVAIDEGGGLVAVGRNAEGQLGNGSTTSSTSQVKVGTLANVTDFSVGQTSAAAIMGGQLWAWGWNGSAPVTTPTRVGTGTGFTKVVVGDIHSLAIGPGGEIYSWGDSSFGALGRSGSAGTPGGRHAAVSSCGTSSSPLRHVAAFGGGRPATMVGAAAVDDIKTSVRAQFTTGNNV